MLFLTRVVFGRGEMGKIINQVFAVDEEGMTLFITAGLVRCCICHLLHSRKSPSLTVSPFFVMGEQILRLLRDLYPNLILPLLVLVRLNSSFQAQ